MTISDRRLRRLETDLPNRDPKCSIKYPTLSAADQAFFDAMIARSLAGDRNWSEADQRKYHAMLLGEWVSDPNARAE